MNGNYKSQEKNRDIPKYRFFDVNVNRFGINKMLIHSKRTGTVKLLPSNFVQVLLSCESFRSLEKHAIAFCKSIRNTSEKNTYFPIQEQEIKSVKALLNTFVNNGFLVSEAEIRANIMKLAKKDSPKHQGFSNRITTLGIPTCNRPSYLERALTSYLENCRNYGRTVKVVIIDNSNDSKTRRKNKQILKALKSEFGTSIYYADQKRKEEYSKLLSQKGKVPSSVTEYGLLGDNRLQTPCGANRNAILINSVGEICLQADDDTICKIAKSPNTKSGLSFDSSDNPNDFFYPQTKDEMLQSLSVLQEDFLGIHEKLLGKSVKTVISEVTEKNNKIDFSNISTLLLRNILNGAQKIAFTFTGSFGCSCCKAEEPYPRFFTNADSLNRLIQNENLYESRLNTPFVIRVPGQLTINDGRSCISVNIGIDNREIFPPFMPNYKSEENILNAIINNCFGRYLKGFLPYMIQHDFSEYNTKISRTKIPKRMPFDMNSIIISIIGSFKMGFPKDDQVTSLNVLGNNLNILGNLSLSDFKDYLRNICSNELSKTVQYLELLLKKNKKAPKLWQDDIKTFILEIEKLVCQKDFPYPINLQHKKDKGIGLLRDQVSQLGNLLIHWEAIYETAVKLKNSGQSLAKEL